MKSRDTHVSSTHTRDENYQAREKSGGGYNNKNIKKQEINL